MTLWMGEALPCPASPLCPPAPLICPCPYRRVYLDYNATTPLAPEVAQAVWDAMCHAWGNPSSSHPAGRDQDGPCCLLGLSPVVTGAHGSC